MAYTLSAKSVVNKSTVIINNHWILVSFIKSKKVGHSRYSIIIAQKNILSLIISQMLVQETK